MASLDAFLDMMAAERGASPRTLDAYGRDLCSRWTAVNEWESHPSDDEPNQIPPETPT